MRTTAETANSPMATTDTNELIQRLHESAAKCVIYATGGGSQVRP